MSEWEKVLNEQIFNMAEFDHRVYYLCVPYSVNPDESVKRNFEYMKALLDMGKFAFSPVAHTHFFHQYWKEKGIDIKWEQYIEWDKRILGNFHHESESMIIGIPNESVVCLMAEGWEKSEGCMKEWKFAQYRLIHRLLLEPFLEKRIRIAKPNGVGYNCRR